jgi:ABC-type dipeptide/oligopeptide/nickel transport system permease component
MATFIIRRIVWTIPVILLVILMTFLMMKQIGGNPFRHTERNVPEAIQRNLEKKFNLDKPWYEQYIFYVKDVATFDLGPSMSQRTRTVNDIIKDGFPKSLKLGILAFLWAVFLGIPLGVLAALKPNSIFDYFAMFFSSIGFALPSFFVATILIYWVALKGGLVPVTGWPNGFFQFDDRVILPSFALGLFPMAYCARLVRGSMLETMQQDYVRTARAKGLPYKRVIGLHVLRNSLIPAVTATAPLLGLIITGTFIIEIIFSIPGIGRYFITSVSNRDFSVVLGITVLTSLIIIVANLFVDIMYGILDPRTREAR